MIKLNGRGLIGDEMGLADRQALAPWRLSKKQGGADCHPIFLGYPVGGGHPRVAEGDRGQGVRREHKKDKACLDNRFVIISYDFIPKMQQLLKEKTFR